MTRDLPTYTIDELEDLSTTQFEEMTNEDAVNLGLVAIEVITEWELSLAVDIVLAGDLVFRAKLGQTGAGNDQWLAGKAAVVNKYGEPSLLVKLRHEASGTEFVEETADGVILRAHGGSIPLRVNGAVVGTITMSGEPDVLDHAAAAEAIRRFVAE